MISAIIHWDHKQPMDVNNMRYIYQLWDYVCRSYGIPNENVIYVDCNGTLAALSPPNPIVYTLQDALSSEILQGSVPVYVHGSGTQELPNFEHPENAVYIFGPNYETLHIPDGVLSVRVPLCAEPMTMFSQSCLPIVLYDRFRR